jgi:hypothetical protein
MLSKMCCEMEHDHVHGCEKADSRERWQGPPATIQRVYVDYGAVHLQRCCFGHVKTQFLSIYTYLVIFFDVSGAATTFTLSALGEGPPRAPLPSISPLPCVSNPTLYPRRLSFHGSRLHEPQVTCFQQLAASCALLALFCALAPFVFNNLRTLLPKQGGLGGSQLIPSSPASVVARNSCAFNTFHTISSKYRTISKLQTLQSVRRLGFRSADIPRL